ncbi:uncharacterized protein F5891DRAFT_899804, partial [Suillus fuscotomentosus]
RPIAIHLSDDSKINAIGLGSIQCVQHLNGERHHLIINDVLYAPDLAVTLLSVRRLAHRNRIMFDRPLCQICDRKSNQVIVEGVKRNNLYHLISEPM